MPRAQCNCGNAQRQLGNLEAALALYDKACEAEPSLSAAWLNRAHARRAAKRWSDAASDYRHALELGCGDGALSARTKLGLVLFELKRESESIELLRRCVAESKSSGDASLALCSVLERSGRAAEALGVARAAVAANSNDALCHLQYGALLYEAGAVKESVEQCERATALDSKSSDAWNQLGVSLLALERTADAEHALRTAIDKANAVNDRSALAAATRNLGHLYDEASRHNEAERVLLDSLRAEPDNVDTLNKLGSCMSALGRHDDAEKHFRKALSVDERDINTHYNLAAALANRGRLRDALQHCTRALAIDAAFTPAVSMKKQLESALE